MLPFEPLISHVWLFFLPQLTPDSMMGKTLDLFDEAIGVQRLDGFDHAAMERAPSLQQEPAIGYLVGQGVLERVLHIGIEPSLIKELSCLQMLEPPLQLIIWLFRYCRQERDWHVLADH